MSTSFLPEDYLDQKAERRTIVVLLTLFAVVMVAVFAAFLVMNRKWMDIQRRQRAINVEYQEAAVQIERLNELEEQKNQMLHKAQLAAALVERVPRSILLAELIRLMPQPVGLVGFDLKSTKRKTVTRIDPQDKPGRLRARRERMRRGMQPAPTRKIEPPEYDVRLNVKGVAPTDPDVARFLGGLNEHPLFQNVVLQYSEEKELDGVPMRMFEIQMVLSGEMDVRDIAPLMSPEKLNNPGKKPSHFPGGQASVGRVGRGGG